jgi:hypothetical protein
MSVIWLSGFENILSVPSRNRKWLCCLEYKKRIRSSVISVVINAGRWPRSLRPMLLLRIRSSENVSGDEYPLPFLDANDELMVSRMLKTTKQQI